MSSIFTTSLENDPNYGRAPLVLRHTPSSARLDTLPMEVLFFIMEALLPTWALEDTHDGPNWTVSDVTEPLDITVATHCFHALTLASRRTCGAATPYLYRIVHVRDTKTLLSLWDTLARLRPLTVVHVRHLLFGLTLADVEGNRLIANTLAPLCTSSETVAKTDKGVQRYRRESVRMRWASGEALRQWQLASETPPIKHRVVFDVVRRCRKVQSLTLKPSSFDGATLMLRWALAEVAGPRLISGPVVVLQSLRCVTLQVRLSNSYLSLTS